MTRPNPVETLETLKKFLTICGIWPEYSSRFYQFYGFITSVLSQILFLMPCGLQIYLKPEALAEGILGVCISIVGTAYVSKCIIFLAKKSDLLHLLRLIHTPVFQSHCQSLDHHVEKAIKNSVTITRYFLYSGLAWILFSAVAPILFSGERRLPFTLPFEDQLSSNCFWVVYALQTWSGFTGAGNTICFDCLLYSMLAMSIAYLRILRAQLENITTERSKNLQGLSDSEFDLVVKENLVKSIRLHQAIIEYSTLVENSFNYLLLVQALNSVAELCIVIFGIIVTPIQESQSAVLIVFFLTQFYELVMYCIFGNELIYQSQKIHSACYNTEWNLFNPSNRKLLFIMMDRSSKPLTLTAGKFVNLSYSTLLGIFRLSFSYLTVLRKVYE